MTARTLQHPSVLLVDDESFSEEIVSHGLKACGQHTFRFTPHAASAVDVAREMAATVVLVDMRMPGMDGFEVTRRLCADKHTEHVAVIILSSEDNPDMKARAFEVGASDYLVKWPDPRELVESWESSGRFRNVTVELGKDAREVDIKADVVRTAPEGSEP